MDGVGNWMDDHLGQKKKKKTRVVLLGESGWRKWSSATPPTTTIIECGLTFIRFQPGRPVIGVYVEV